MLTLWLLGKYKIHFNNQILFNKLKYITINCIIHFLLNLPILTSEKS